MPFSMGEGALNCVICFKRQLENFPWQKIFVLCKEPVVCQRQWEFQFLCLCCVKIRKSKIDYVMYLFIPFLSVNGLMSVFLRSLDHYDRSVLYHCQHEANTWYTLPVDPRLSVYTVICETIHLPSLIVMRISQRNKRLLHCMWPFICTCFARPQHSFISDCYLSLWFYSFQPVSGFYLFILA